MSFRPVGLPEYYLEQSTKKELFPVKKTILTTPPRNGTVVPTPFKKLYSGAIAQLKIPEEQMTTCVQVHSFFVKQSEIEASIQNESDKAKTSKVS